jgi:hypothetical protein
MGKVIITISDDGDDQFDVKMEFDPPIEKGIQSASLAQAFGVSMLEAAMAEHDPIGELRVSA